MRSAPAKSVFVRETDVQEVLSSYIYLLLAQSLLILVALLLPSAHGLKWFVFALAWHVAAPFISTDRLEVFENTEGADKALSLAPWNCFIWCLTTLLNVLTLVMFILCGFIVPLSASIVEFRKERLEYFIAIVVWMGVLTVISLAQALLTYMTTSTRKLRPVTLLKAAKKEKPAE